MGPSQGHAGLECMSLCSDSVTHSPLTVLSQASPVLHLFPQEQHSEHHGEQGHAGSGAQSCPLPADREPGPPPHLTVASNSDPGSGLLRTKQVMAAPFPASDGTCRVGPGHSRHWLSQLPCPVDADHVSLGHGRGSRAGSSSSTHVQTQVQG